MVTMSRVETDMTETEHLVAELRRYMARDVPTAIALWALNHAMAERPQGVIGAAWVIERAANLIRRSR